MDQTNVVSESTVIAKMKELYNKHGKLTWSIFVSEGFPQSQWRRYGTFNDLLQKADLPLNIKHRVTKKELVEDVIRVQEQFGNLTQELYLKYGKYSRKPIIRIFGSWNKMLLALDIEPNCLINNQKKICYKILEICIMNMGQLARQLLNIMVNIAVKFTKDDLGQLTKRFARQDFLFKQLVVIRLWLLL